MPRGKGTLEVKPSTNPFFQTTNQNIGRKVEEIPWQAPEVWRPKVLTENEGYFDMHFAKPKNDYGASVPLSDSATSRAMRLEESPGDVATKLGEGLYVAQQPPPHQAPAVKASVEEVLAAYNHRTKPQNPVYTTAANDIGFKKPDLSTFNNDRLSVPQAFSNSFNGVKYRDLSLSTGLSKSQFHSKLDPQFL